MTTYRGDPTKAPEDCVTADGRPLALYLKDVNHSPSGFGWGYGGSGPAQLAYAILRHHLRDKTRAQMVYQDFKFEVIANLPREQPWELTSEQINETMSVKKIVVKEVLDG